MEQIDIKALESLQENLRKNNKKEIVLNEDNKEVTFYSISDVLYYTEKVHNKIIRVSGNSTNGFIKKEISVTSEIENRSEFYPTGNLKRVGQVKYRSDKTDYPVGIWYSYDKGGNIIEKTEYNYDDSLFIFSEAEILKWIRRENLDHGGKWKTTIQKWPQVTVNDIVKDEAIWLVQIYNEDAIGITTIIIDAKTGKKISEKFDKIVK